MTNLQTAIQLHKSGQLAEAETLYRQLLNQEPERADILHLLGIVLAQQKKFNAALTYLQQAVTINPMSPAYQNSLGNTYKYLAKLDAAMDHYQIAIKIDPTYAIAYNNLANCYTQQQHDAAAITNYQLALQHDPNYVDAHYNLAMVYLKQDNLQAAQKHFEKTLQLVPQHANAHSQLGNLLQKKKHHEAAVAHYTQSLALRPNHPETQHDMATALIQLERYDQAIEHLKIALQLNPKYSAALHNLASIYVLLHQTDAALQYYMRLLEIAPDIETYYNIGVMLMYKDRHKEALGYFEQALALDPKYLAAHINIGTTYLKQQDYANAAKHYQIAHELQPDNQEVRYILYALTQRETPKAAPSEYLQNLFDQYAPYFEKHLMEHLEYQVPQKIYNAVIQCIDIDKTYKIIDLGCGTGLCGQLFKSIASELIGIDISQRMLDIARQKNSYTQLINADITTALEQINQADIIVAADVFTYIGDLKHIFSACRKALKPKGLFAFTVEKTFSQDYELQKTARFAHNKEYITNLATENGFKIERFENATLRKQNKQWLEGYLVLLHYSAHSFISLPT